MDLQANSAFETDQASPEILAELGNAHLRQGRFAEAEQAYLAALAGEGNCAAAHNGLADMRLPGEDYQEILKRLHDWLKPAGYVEIGVCHGESLRLAQAPTRAVGVDPAPRLLHRLSATATIFQETSDAFFAARPLSEALGGASLDMAFIDGLHTFEQALADFINLERWAHPRSVFLIHDCWPLDEPTQTRERLTAFWTGDVWRVMPMLKARRPDLTMFTIKARPSGLGVVTNLDPSSTVLRDRYMDILGDGLTLSFAELEAKRDEMLCPQDNDWDAIQARLVSAWDSRGLSRRS
ncbi:MAG: class I SAM-dependent methyltransferase [Rhodospirillales bacterium]|nr:class I SAM-dependent methyltransferase [Rhodospirillales bacterium]